MGGKSNHASSGAGYKARWGRSSNYRKKTMQGIKAKPERVSVYDNEVFLRSTLSKVTPRKSKSGRLTPGCPEHCARYKLDKFASGRQPYPNHAHHMIPANAFINRFTAKQADILRRIDYDVNNGNNMIYLPATLSATRYHRLPWHQTDDYHDRYSEKVRKAAGKLEDQIDAVLDKEKPCEEQDVPGDIVKDLVKYEDLLWDVIVKLGEQGPVSINVIEMQWE